MDQSQHKTLVFVVEVSLQPALHPILFVCLFACLQVDLGFLRFITAIETQGAISKETRKRYFVRTYKVDLSSNGEDWVTVKEGSKQKVPFIQ